MGAVVPLRNPLMDAERRSIELYDTLNVVVAHANHVISNMATLLEEDPRLATPEWQVKMADWQKVWMNATALLLNPEMPVHRP